MKSVGQQHGFDMGYRMLIDSIKNMLKTTRSIIPFYGAVFICITGIMNLLGDGKTMYYVGIEHQLSDDANMCIVGVNAVF